MRAHTDDAAAFDHDNLVGLDHRRDPLRHDEHGGIGRDLTQGRAHPRVGVYIEGRERIVSFRSAYHGDTFGAMALCDPETGMHRMFGRDWRSTVMASNAGEGALKASRRKGGRPLSGITRSYPDKLHAIACLFDEHAKRERWRKSIARPVPKLSPRILAAGTRNLHAWARKQGLDPRLVAALNPGWHVGSLEILAPIGANAGRPAASKAN